MDKREKLLSLAARLQEYRVNPHHVNPMSESFHKLIVQVSHELALIAHENKAKASIAGWGINRLGNMISSNTYTQHNGRMVRSVPTPYRKNIKETIRAAWWVLTGKAEAVIWPQPSELENAISGGFECGRINNVS